MKEELFEKRVINQEDIIEVFSFFLEDQNQKFLAKKLEKNGNKFLKKLEKEIKRNSFISIEKNEIDVVTPFLRKRFDWCPHSKRWIAKGYLTEIGEYERREVDTCICFQKENYLLFYETEKKSIIFLIFVVDFVSEKNFLFAYSLQNMPILFIKNLNNWLSNLINKRV